MKRILVIEPYYGGSHKGFLDGLTAAVDAHFTLMSLPARKWKMRMQLSAPWFIGQIEALPTSERHFDTVMFSSFIDVAVFKAMTQSVAGWNSRCRLCAYFHENQFAYPGFLDRRMNHQFAAINFTTALTSDSTAFNSHFNRSAFLNQCRKYLAKATDMDLSPSAVRLEEKSTVLYPGMDFTTIDRLKGGRTLHAVPRIIWNHRWEHDKNPEVFVDALYRLAGDGLDFELAILGQTFRNRPPCFEALRRKLGDRIVHYGYVAAEEAYCRCLVEGDIVVSTALHEYFGISILEAVRAGCLPVLPDRLVYPELFDGRYLYVENGLYERLRTAVKQAERLPEEEAMRLTEPFDWRHQAPAYARWLGL